MKNVLVISWLTFSFLLSGQVQNLVPNPSFEFTNGTGCPYTSAGWDKMSNWTNVNLITGQGVWGTPDYYAPCGSGNTAPPNTFQGFCYPNTGSSMTGFVFYNTPYPGFREYLMTQLTCSMLPGTTYTVSFWITNGPGPISPWTIKNIGIHFSNGPLSQSTYEPLAVIPQCEVITNVASTTWINCTFTINPTSAWDYLTFGSFRSDSENSPVQTYPNLGGNPSVYAYYFVDDIDVLAPAPPPALNIVSSATSGICAGQSATLWASGAGNYAWWANSPNNTPTAGVSVVVQPTVQTMYFVSSTGSCGNTIKDSVVINVHPNPTLSIAGPATVCPGISVQLHASGASSYTWSTGNHIPVITTTPTSNYSVYQVTGKNTFGCLATTSHTVMVMECLPAALDEPGTHVAGVYPNPSPNELTVRLRSGQVAEIRIVDVAGAEVKLFRAIAAEQQTTLHVPELLPGVYTVHILTTSGARTFAYWIKE